MKSRDAVILWNENGGHAIACYQSETALPQVIIASLEDVVNGRDLASWKKVYGATEHGWDALEEGVRMSRLLQHLKTLSKFCDIDNIERQILKLETVSQNEGTRAVWIRGLREAAHAV